MHDNLIENDLLENLPNKVLNKYVLNILKINEINNLYVNNLNLNPIIFIEEILKDLNIKVIIDQNDLDKIPENNSFITISNHPLGGIDGLILLYVVLKKRPDYKIIANYLLKNIKPIENVIFPVNNFDSADKKNILNIRQAIVHLKNNYPVGIFPAGEVSSIDFKKKKVSDKQWETSMIKFIKKANQPIVPIYFEGKGLAVHARYYQGIEDVFQNTEAFPIFGNSNKSSYFAITLDFPFLSDELAAKNAKPKEKS